MVANQNLSMNKLRLELRLLIEGKSRRHISRTAEISRTSVDKYAIIFNGNPLSLLELYKLENFDLQVIVNPEYQCKSSLVGLYSHYQNIIRKTLAYFDKNDVK